MATTLQRSWALTARTPVIIVPALVVAAIWQLIAHFVGNVERAPDGVVLLAGTAMYGATAAAAIIVTAFAAAGTECVSGASGWTILRRRGLPAMIAFLVMGILGLVAAAGLHSFLWAWVLGSFALVYVGPMVVAGKRGSLRSLVASLGLACARPAATFGTAAVVDVIAVGILVASGFVAAVPVIGAFAQTLLVQAALGFSAAFALFRFTML